MRTYHLKILFLAILVLTIASNSGGQGMMGGDNGMMGRGHHRQMMQRMMGDMLPPPMDPADLPEPESAGAQLIQQFCTQCHYLYGPGLHTAEEWPSVVERMNRRMQMMGGRHMMMGTVEAPSSEQLAVITEYLQKYAQKPLPRSKASELKQKEGAGLYRIFCSRCHVLPDPAQYPARKWPVVVERMQRYMEEADQALPTEDEWRQIVDFLKTNSAQIGEGKGAD